METKYCAGCEQDKPVDAFSLRLDSRDGRNGRCRACKVKGTKRWNAANPQRRRTLDQEHCRRQRRKDPSRARQAVREYRERHPHYHRDYERTKRREDMAYRLGMNLRTRIWHALKVGRAGSAVRDLGCTIPDLRVHLETQFQPGMSWENYGMWHIDHRRPLAGFDLTDRDQFLQACHYTNLQPLWAEQNLAKGSREVA